jgi:hypothetical protein
MEYVAKEACATRHRQLAVTLSSSRRRSEDRYFCSISLKCPLCRHQHGLQRHSYRIVPRRLGFTAGVAAARHARRDCGLAIAFR